MRGDGADRVDDVWQMSDGSSALAASLNDIEVEDDLLAYAQRTAARAGTAWYVAEFRRREEEEQRGPEAKVDAAWQAPQIAVAPVVEDQGLVDASAEDQLIGGAPSSLGFASPLKPTVEPEAVEPEAVEPEAVEPEPVVRHPHVPRPPDVAPNPRAKRGRRKRGREPEAQALPPAISAPEWARMSPGARRLYGVNDLPGATAAG
jgi:hypothetical protein